MDYLIIVVLLYVRNKPHSALTIMQTATLALICSPAVSVHRLELICRPVFLCVCVVIIIIIIFNRLPILNPIVSAQQKEKKQQRRSRD